VLISAAERLKFSIAINRAIKNTNHTN